MRERIMGLGAIALLLGGFLIVSSVALFVIYAILFSEGYEGSWDSVVLESAWLSFYGGVFSGAAGMVGLLLAALRTVFVRRRGA